MREPEVACDGPAIIRHHHERLDGGGYPDGLRGDQVPLLAQIVSITDAYDAMTTTRPYRPALPIEHALDELSADVAKGMHRADLVDTFAQLTRSGRLSPTGLARHDSLRKVKKEPAGVTKCLRLTPYCDGR